LATVQGVHGTSFHCPLFSHAAYSSICLRLNITAYMGLTRLDHVLCLALLLLGTRSGFGLIATHSDKTKPSLESDFDLWDGVDRDVFHLAATNSSDQPTLYAFLAPMDSGSNLLAQLIEANWPGQFKSSFASGFLWKHSLATAEEIYSFLETNEPMRPLSHVHFLAAVRSPISQVASWINAPYDLWSCVRRPQLDLLKPCSARLRPRRHETLPAVHFESAMDIYNKYMSLYKQVVADGRFKSAHVIPYEEMVRSPESVVRLISNIFGATLHGRPETIDDPSKPGNTNMVKKPNGREAALHKLEQRAYLNNFDTGVVAALCSKLDRSLVEDIVESEHVQVRIPYTHDCDN